MNLAKCNGAKPCPHFATVGVTPHCNVFAMPVASVGKCNGKLIKLALKKQKHSDKLKGKHP